MSADRQTRAASTRCPAGASSAEGAPRKLTELDARFRRPLMSFFMRRLGDRSEAEDLTQQVFLRILAAQSEGKLDHPEGFVFTVATNLLRDRGRRQVRRGVCLPLDSLSPADLAHPDLVEFSPERILIGRERLGAALAALTELGGRTGEIFVLSRLDSLRQREIAQRFGIGLSTVEKHVIRATRRLAQTRAES
jgi:RNA polymerase sigma-70 factor (ECF subfamily)